MSSESSMVNLESSALACKEHISILMVLFSACMHVIINTVVIAKKTIKLILTK